MKDQFSVENAPDKNLTGFYKEYNSLKVRQTGIFCTEEIVGGLNQTAKKLNSILNEEAGFDVRSDYYSVTKHHEISAQWMNQFYHSKQYIRS